MTGLRIVLEPHDSGGLTQLIRDKIAFHNVAAEVFGVLDDFPPGHAKYFLHKNLKG